MTDIRRQEALEYHRREPRGKLEISPTKPCRTQRDLSLAYTPGVAEPCLEIHRDPELSFDYTVRGNLVAVVTNGTAVLGLGQIGALAGKPVMEGKAVLFKRFADIDVFDLEVNSTNPEDVIRVCQLLEPSFGAINLEDIKAPECFEIEDRLRETLSIPVFHDDQHGTAIISGAALLNALELAEKQIEEVKVVISGAGAAGLGCASHYLRLGLQREQMILCDIHGVVYEGREEGMNPRLAAYAAATSARTLSEALKGADVFIGLSVGGYVTPEMLQSMAARPVVFAMANPVPEIGYAEAKAARPDAIVATGRSDFPNQVNNVLGFPFIFRGALDVRAHAINAEMAVAATRALAALAKEGVPDAVLQAYGLGSLRFGPDYIIPKPFDPRVLIWESAAVAGAAMRSGVARVEIDLDEYRDQLSHRLGRAYAVMQAVHNRAKLKPRRVVFSEGEHEKIIRASYQLVEDRIACPILIGRRAAIESKLRNLGLQKLRAEIIEPESFPRFAEYAEELFRLRQRRGVTRSEARELMANPNYFGVMMLRMGDADGFVAGLTQHYPDTIRPALQVIDTRPEVRRVCGVYVIITKRETYFFADTTVNIDPTAEQLAEIAWLAAETARQFHVAPRVAMLSFSNFGSTRHAHSDKVREATELVKRKFPDMVVDGEMMADTAVVPEMIEEEYPFSTLQGGANVLIFPDLGSANIAYKLMMRIGGAEALGPILMGLSKPVHVLQRGGTVEEIVNMAAIAGVHGQFGSQSAYRERKQNSADQS
jgi:malate dehydrogenase (oxaloacetate-decarboxylating)(NADP+)